MKTKTNLIRVVLFLLVSVFVLTALAGCKNGKAPKETEPIENDSDDMYDADGYLNDALPDNLDFDFDDVTILGWNTTLVEFDVKDLSGDEIDDAIFERDAAIEERIKVELVYTLTDGNAKAIDNYKKVVENAIRAGKPYDIIAGYTRSTAICATGGLLMDLGNLEDGYTDWDAPWWNQSIIEKTSVGNSFFFTTGDIAPSYVQMLYCVHFNAELIEDRGLTSPYEHVANNMWTLETLMGMTQNFYQDLDESNSKDLGDNIPLVAQYYDWPALLHGCGVGNVIRDDATGRFVLDPALSSDKGIGIMGDLADMLMLDNCYIAYDQNIVNPFKAEKNLFLVAESSVPARKFSDVEFEYGCVPCPKYDSEQENYISTARQPVTLYGISKGVDSSRIGMITATMEAMASESYRSLTPVIFDRIMQYQKAASDEMSKMLVLIRDTGWFDCGRIHAADISYLCDQPGHVLMEYPSKTWEGYVNGTLNTTVKAQVEKLNETLIKAAS